MLAISSEVHTIDRQFRHVSMLDFHCGASVAILKPPPTTTLFPYTTLFRSSREAAVAEARAFLAERPYVRAEEARRTLGPDVGDRKSTRLNSSHRCISYAVFCLKKKSRADLEVTLTLRNSLSCW